MHIYLTKAVKKDGAMVLTDNLGYRGEAGEHDDPESFKRLMEARGLKVHLSETYLGRLIDSDLNTLEN